MSNDTKNNLSGGSSNNGWGNLASSSGKTADGGWGSSWADLSKLSSSSWSSVPSSWGDSIGGKWSLSSQSSQNSWNSDFNQNFSPGLNKSTSDAKNNSLKTIGSGFNFDSSVSGSGLSLSAKSGSGFSADENKNSGNSSSTGGGVLANSKDNFLSKTPSAESNSKPNSSSLSNSTHNSGGTFSFSPGKFDFSPAGKGAVGNASPSFNLGLKMNSTPEGKDTGISASHALSTGLNTGNTLTGKDSTSSTTPSLNIGLKTNNTLTGKDSTSSITPSLNIGLKTNNTLSGKDSTSSITPSLNIGLKTNNTLAGKDTNNNMSSLPSAGANFNWSIPSGDSANSELLKLGGLSKINFSSLGGLGSSKDDQDKDLLPGQFHFGTGEIFEHQEQVLRSEADVDDENIVFDDTAVLFIYRPAKSGDPNGRYVRSGKVRVTIGAVDGIYRVLATLKPDDEQAANLGKKLINTRVSTLRNYKDLFLNKVTGVLIPVLQDNSGPDSEKKKNEKTHSESTEMLIHFLRFKNEETCQDFYKKVLDETYK